MLELKFDERGDLTFQFGVTEMACPRFVYNILIVKRRGITSICGEPVSED